MRDVERKRIPVEVYRDGVRLPRGLLRDLRLFLQMVGSRECRPCRFRVSVILTSDRRMADLNEIFLGETGPTDVLAFPDEKQAEIYLSVEEARRRGDVRLEVARLALHGLLHLCGHEHGRAMSEKEEGFLLCWN